MSAVCPVYVQSGSSRNVPLSSSSFRRETLRHVLQKNLGTCGFSLKFLQQKNFEGNFLLRQVQI